MGFSIKNYKPHYIALITLGIPIVIGQMSTIVLGFADTLMIGHHSTIELAAAGFINNVFSILLIFALGFSSGLVPIAGSMYGEGRQSEIGRMVKNSLAANIILSLVLVVVSLLLYAFLDRLGQPDELIPIMRPYLLIHTAGLPFVSCFNVFKQFFDSIGYTRAPMAVMVFGVGFNIVANYLLIYGVKIGGDLTIVPELGLIGAGIATLMARVLMAAGIVALFLRLKVSKRYREDYRTAQVNKEDLKAVNTMGWPLAVQAGLESAAFMSTVIMVGWIGAMPLAADQIMLSLSTLFFMVYYGMAGAIAVRVSHFHGMRDSVSANRSTWAGFHIIMVVALIISIPIWSSRHEISYLFTDSTEVCQLVASCIPLLILYQFGDGLQCSFGNALRGLGCAKAMMIVSFIAYFIVSLPLSYIFAFPVGWGLRGVWTAFPICLTLAGVLYYAAFRYYRRRMF